MRDDNCPFCGHYPYHDVDIGVGYEHAAVVCCDLGISLIQYNGARAIRILNLLESTDNRQQRRGNRLVKEHFQSNGY